MFTYVSWYSAMLWKISHGQKKNGFKDYGINEVILGMNTIACIDRLIWVFGTINGRTFESQVYGVWCKWQFIEFISSPSSLIFLCLLSVCAIVSRITLKIMQVFAMAELMLLSLTWREIVKSSNEMRKSNSKFTKYVTYAFVGFLVTVPVAFDVIGYGTGNHIWANVSKYVFSDQSVYILFLYLGSLLEGRRRMSLPICLHLLSTDIFHQLTFPSVPLM